MKFQYLLFIALSLSLQHLKAQQVKPNIVLILADDLGVGDLGCYGQTIIQTPNIDRLAAQGILFNQFYAGTSVCAPSRSSLMTGLHTGHTYIRGNKELQPEGQEPLADSIQTIAMKLKNLGYSTGAFGKWGLGMIGSTGDPTKKGFDTFYGYVCQRQSHRYYPTHLWHNDVKITLDGNDLQQKISYAPALIQEQTLTFIDQNKDRPFFLFVPTVLPHAELAGPEDEFFKKYENAFDEKPHQGEPYGPKATVAGYTSVDKPRATYAAMVERMDAYVGQIVSKLEALNLLENTIIIFTSDNGAHREGGANPDFFNSTAGLKGSKRDLYEGGIRVPFIVKWQNNIQPQQTTSHVAAFWDLTPTLLQLANNTSNSRTDGISLSPTLLNREKQKEHKYLYWEFHEDGGRQAVRYKNWKLIRQKVKHPKETYVELFDLKKDPFEKNNIANKKKSIVAKLMKYMNEAHIESSIFPLLPVK